MAEQGGLRRRPRPLVDTGIDVCTLQPHMRRDDRAQQRPAAPTTDSWKELQMADHENTHGQDGRKPDAISLIKESADLVRAVQEKWESLRATDPDIPLTFERIDLIKAIGRPYWDYWAKYLRFILDDGWAVQAPVQPDPRLVEQWANYFAAQAHARLLEKQADLELEGLAGPDLYRETKKQVDLALIAASRDAARGRSQR
jgi:hypothetical protein